MSLRFSRPLNGYWVEFLLSYGIKGYSSATYGRLVPKDKNKAKRFHEATIRDSPRQVAIMQALVQIADNSFASKTETVEVRVVSVD